MTWGRARKGAIQLIQATVRDRAGPGLKGRFNDTGRARCTPVTLSLTQGREDMDEQCFWNYQTSIVSRLYASGPARMASFAFVTRKPQLGYIHAATVGTG